MSEKRVSVRMRAEGGRQVRAEFEGVGDSGERAFQRIGREADATSAIVRRVAGMIGAALSVRQVVAYADTWTDLQSRVQLAVGSHEAGIAVMGRLGDMARRTYSDLGQTVESWLANSTALRELGMSTSESLDFTEAMNNALVVSGARAERAAQINNALAQAMALGQLRGQQLNTVIMNGGRVAELLADELGVNVNELRALGAQGRITGDVIRRALVGNLELLREEADSMPATIGDAFTLINNAALRLVGTYDQMLGASAAVAAALIVFADNLERVAVIAFTFAGFMAARWVAGFVAARLATLGLVGALTALRGALIRTGIGAIIVLAGELIYQFTRLVRGAGGFGAAVGLMGTLVRATFKGMGNVLTAWGFGFQAMTLDLESVWTGFIAYLAQKWADFLGTIAPTWNEIMETIGVDRLQIDALGAEAYASAMEHAAGNRAHLAEQMRQREQDGLATAFDEAREALAALMATVKASDDMGASHVEGLEEALNNAAAAAGGAGRASAEAAEEAATGWQLAADQVRKYAEEAMDLAGQLGGAMIGAFRGAENAVAEFVRTGKFDFRSLATSIIADLARIAARRFILGPIANALSGALGGLGGLGGGAMPGGKVLSLDGGGHTGHGARVGGLDGLGGRLAIVHPGERFIDDSRPGQRGGGGFAPAANVHFHGVRDMQSFRQSRSQIASDLSRAVSAGQRGM